MTEKPSLLDAARIGQRTERQRVLRMIDDMTWAASISPQPAAPVVVERLEWLRRMVAAAHPIEEDGASIGRQG